MDTNRGPVNGASGGHAHLMQTSHFKTGSYIYFSDLFGRLRGYTYTYYILYAFIYNTNTIMHI